MPFSPYEGIHLSSSMTTRHHGADIIGKRGNFTNRVSRDSGSPGISAGPMGDQSSIRGSKLASLCGDRELAGPRNGGDRIYSVHPERWLTPPFIPAYLMMTTFMLQGSRVRARGRF